MDHHSASQPTSEKVIILGAGLVGSLLGIYMAKRGHEVEIYERRSDPRKASAYAGRSINLALSDRGWAALDRVGMREIVREVAMPMSHRAMHAVDGEITHQAYGDEGQAIYSVSRGGLNATLLSQAEAMPNVKVFFEYRLEELDLATGTLHFHTPDGQLHLTPKVCFGADGAFSALRTSLMKRERFNYAQNYIDYGYKELSIPANPDGSHKLSLGALHIWPRGRYMMIALPNLDGSFTCTLFFPYEGEPSFSVLKTPEQVRAYFEKDYPDAAAMMPQLEEEFFHNPTGSLVTINSDPWYTQTPNGGHFTLIGDAAHAITPFYGQGMNAGFEDCRILDELLDAHNGQWDSALPAFADAREANGEAIGKLAKANFIEMRDRVADPLFLLQKKLEGRLHSMAPTEWVPLYTMVTFSPEIPYVEALRRGQEQEGIMQTALANHPELAETWAEADLSPYLEELRALRQLNSGQVAQTAHQTAEHA